MSGNLPQWTGKTDVMMALPPATLPGQYAPMAKLGEALDMIDPVEQYFYHDVPGDRHGGPQGPPIERQILSAMMTLNLDLSAWDPDRLDEVKKQNIHATAGAIDLLTVGTLLLLRRSFRIILINRKLDDAGATETTGYNLPCCVLAAPIRQPRGTKFTTLSLTFEAHRAPEGHPYAGILYDDNLTDPQ